ncbi:MAG: 3'-5' exonuclease [Kiritimatiellae bacterium]|nr:3'-5' exonuclease [Kiritimatiellia bacterium]
MKLNLERPLAVFDIESTGINRKTDRVIDLAIIKIMPNGEQKDYTYRVNPGIPIPKESTDIHGITDADVEQATFFKEIAPDVIHRLENCDLGGFNIVHFDIPLLCEEYARAGIPFILEGRQIIDAQRIYHKKEPRDLSAALAFYCGKKHTGAHGALKDVEATIHVLEGQLDTYPDLPHTPKSLNEYCNPRDRAWIDYTGRLKWESEEAVINFGKNKGRTLRNLATDDPGFLKWILKTDFPSDTQDIIRNALAGRYPKK